jgi:multicomponent Na+:H+ antiporter subunit D
MVEFTAFPPAFLVLAAALAVPFASRRVGHAIGAATTAIVTVWSYGVPAGTYLQTTFLGFEVVLFNVDDFSRLMGVIFGLIGTVAVLYSYASDADNVQTAYALSYVGTSFGAVFAGDWLVLLFFWELMAITSTVLVWHYGGEAVRAGFRYAILHGIGGSLLMAGIIWHYAEVGSFLFGASEGITPGLPAVLAAVGIGVNVGFVGLHAWLPDTYPRPHLAASVFLCVYTTKTGVYGMYRAFPEGELAIAYMGGAMAVFGAGFALLQNDMRRLLSYHIQSQVGYMVAGVGIGTALATAGAMAHVYNHILYKSLLFMTAGVIIYRTGGENLKKVGGLGREMPLTAIAFAIAALSISGFPGFNGFVSKGMITEAAHHEHIDALWWLLMIGGVGTFMSFIKFGYYAFLHGDHDGPVEDANPLQSVAMFVVAGLCVLYGVYYEALFELLPRYHEWHEQAHPYTLSHVGEVLVIAAVALVGFAMLKKTLETYGGNVPDIDAVYSPAVFYGTRAVVVGVTETYAAVDRLAVGLARTASETVQTLGRGVVTVLDRRIELRTDIRNGVLVVVVALVVALAILL